MGAVGLPLRIGAMSGMCCTFCTGATFCRPIIGEEVTAGSVGGSCWFLRASDCVRPEYILSMSARMIRGPMLHIHP